MSTLVELLLPYIVQSIEDPTTVRVELTCVEWKHVNSPSPNRLSKPAASRRLKACWPCACKQVTKAVRSLSCLATESWSLTGD